MGSIDQIVNVQISQDTAAVPQQGFGVPLIVGPSNRFTDKVRYYTDTAAMIADGFQLSDPEYIRAVKLMSQALQPEQFGVGKYTASSEVQGIIDIQAVSDIWYGLCICSNDKDVIEDVADYIETQKKIFIAVSADSAVPTSATDDIGSILKGKSLKRTALLYSAVATDGKDAAWLGGQLPATPGSTTWKFKRLVGTTPDVISQTKKNILCGSPGVPGKNVNIYETVGGVNITEEGTMAGGDFIDITIGLDWLESTMQTNVYSLLVQNPKLPYTDAGAAVVENAVRQTLQQGVANGLIDGASEITVTVPKVLSVSQNVRAQRVLPDVKFNCRLAGAFHFVKIVGSVTV